ncbi:uncharacterized protein LOC108597755 [Drosophila busckii]|uniref:uncharacterized protein LOC108597755 n=1 Tax=Drosophila busckii TaxID=30019 RepID=UPI00083F3F1A|nr:uncharacterized protein LOC108597755 [Drosophila busckii]
MRILLLISIIYLNYMREATAAGSCHYFSEKKMDYFDALFTCQKKKLCLADFNTQVLMNEIGSKLPAYKREDYWFGLNAYEKPTFKYVSNLENMVFMAEGATLDYSKPCAYLTPRANTAYTFNSAPCFLYKHFVCSEAEMCNGIATKSAFKATVSDELPCEMSDEVREIFGLPEIKKVRTGKSTG